MFARFFGFGGGKPSIQKLTVHYQKKAYAVTFDAADAKNGHVTVGTLRAKLAELFAVHSGDLALFQIEPRRKLSNDKADLADYDIHNGDALYAAPRPTRTTTEPTKTTSAAAMPPSPAQQLLDAEQAVEQQVGDRIQRFTAAPPADAAAREKEFLVLQEVILQNIIKLDNVEVAGDGELRARRKALINKFHHMHESLDRAKSSPSSAAPAAVPGAAPTPVSAGGPAPGSVSDPAPPAPGAVPVAPAPAAAAAPEAAPEDAQTAGANEPAGDWKPAGGKKRRGKKR